MHHPPDILQRSPEEASRRIALALLESARAASLRLDDPDDAEALHDFRVAIRRLRSTLRAWGDELEESVRKRDRRALRDLHNATGAGRDAEVALVWLEQQRADLAPSQRLGYDWVVDRLARRRDTSMGSARGEVRERFERIREDLGSRLEVVTFRKNLRRPGREPTYGEVLARRARASAAELVELLGRIGSVEDREAAHAARMAGKRFRYLIEPVREHAEAARSVVTRCKRLQDMLGELNDAHVLSEELGAALEEAAAERARRLHELARGNDSASLRRESHRSERSGLVELTRRVQARSSGLFAQLEREWLGSGVSALAEDVQELAAQLEAASRRPVEVERKYLLSGMPDLAGREPEVLEVDQGWLPGDRLRERVRCTRFRDGVDYTRTLKLGQGVERFEIEEPTTQWLFERLWPLTEGCRIRKRRHRVREGERVWEIDEFLDRDLVLVEVELDDPDADPELPDWLAGLVVRDVTDDPRYTNLKLAH